MYIHQVNQSSILYSTTFKTKSRPGSDLKVYGRNKTEKTWPRLLYKIEQPRALFRNSHLHEPSLQGGLLILTAEQQLESVPLHNVLQHPHPVLHQRLGVGRQVVVLGLWKSRRAVINSIQFNSLFRFTQGNTNCTVVQIICNINKLYILSVCFHLYYSWFRLLHYACPVEIGKESVFSHAPPWCYSQGHLFLSFSLSVYFSLTNSLSLCFDITNQQMNDEVGICLKYSINNTVINQQSF